MRKADVKAQSLCDHLADLMFELLFLVASVKGSEDFSLWHLQHNVAWNGMFGHGGKRGAASAVVAFKLRRLLYDEIRGLETFPNYKSARILGLCLYVMGLRESKIGIDRSYFALKKAVLRWAKHNYLRLVQVQPDVAAACLVGSVSFDAERGRLVKTYIKGLSLEAPKEYLELDRLKDETDFLAISG